MTEKPDEFLEWFVEKTFVEAIELEGWFTLKCDKLKRGWPDQVCFGPNGLVVFVEFKRTGAKKNRRGEKLQKHFQEELKKLGFDVREVKGMAEMSKLLEEMEMMPFKEE